MRSSLLLVSFALLGCVSLPHAKLVVIGEGTREVVTGPVVCGPLGFRKVPLQSRWGEYVRVTVAAPSVISGTVLVHANGVAQEPRSWTTESGALVIDARFPNEDPDARFALVRERPIDITLTGLAAPNGGTCEGAVFTVEQGALVPSVDERAWIAELERRGGPELAARREQARVEAEARRQAHYAAWEARQQVQVEASVLAQADLIRQQHYAQWEARHTVSVSVAAEPTMIASSSGLAPTGNAVIAAQPPVAQQTAVVVPTGVAGSAGYEAAWSGANGPPSPRGEEGFTAVQTTSANDGGSFEASLANPFGTSSSGTVVASSGIVASSGGVVASSGGSCGVAAGGVAPPGGLVVASVGSSCGGGAVAGSANFEASLANSYGTSSGGTVIASSGGSAAVDPFATTQLSIPGSVGFEASLNVDASANTVNAPADFAAFPSAPLQPAATVATVGTEWSQPSDATLRNQGQVQTYGAQLQPVAVSSESQIATSAQQPVPVCRTGRCSVPPSAGYQASVAVDGAALFNLMLNVGAAVQVPANVHGAQPVSR